MQLDSTDEKLFSGAIGAAVNNSLAATAFAAATLPKMLGSREVLDEVDVKYSGKGQHYAHYQDNKNLMKESHVQIDEAMESIDDKILQRIRQTEKDYHQQVVKYLHEKETELRTVIQRLEEKNLNTDGKDVLISKLHKLINKIESDGRVLLGRLRTNEEELRLMRD